MQKQFVISGKRRRELKRELYKMKHHYRLSDFYRIIELDMHSLFGSENNIQTNEEFFAYLQNLKSEIEVLENLLKEEM